MVVLRQLGERLAAESCAEWHPDEFRNRGLASDGSESGEWCEVKGRGVMIRCGRLTKRTSKGTSCEGQRAHERSC
jgi:hypothetical protein